MDAPTKFWSFSELLLPEDVLEILENSQGLNLSENTTQEESGKLINQYQTNSHLKITDCPEITNIDLSKWTNSITFKIQNCENLTKITGLNSCTKLEILFISNNSIVSS